MSLCVVSGVAPGSWLGSNCWVCGFACLDLGVAAIVVQLRFAFGVQGASDGVTV